MSAAIGMEVLKTKGRKIWLVVAVMMAVQLLWAGWAISNKDANDLAQGWLFFLYQFPMLNCIIMPVIAAVVASRLSDVEHQGQTFKLLETITPAQRIFAAKFIWGSIYMLGAALGQLAIMIGMGFVLELDLDQGAAREIDAVIGPPVPDQGGDADDDHGNRHGDGGLHQPDEIKVGVRFDDFH